MDINPDTKLPCGHTIAEEVESHGELGLLVVAVLNTDEHPRLALRISDSGQAMLATTLEPGLAADALEELAAKIRSTGTRYIRCHLEERRSASRWN